MSLSPLSMRILASRNSLSTWPGCPLPLRIACQFGQYLDFDGSFVDTVQFLRLSSYEIPINFPSGTLNRKTQCLAFSGIASSRERIVFIRKSFGAGSSFLAPLRKIGGCQCPVRPCSFVSLRQFPVRPTNWWVFIDPTFVTSSISVSKAVVSFLPKVTFPGPLF